MRPGRSRNEALDCSVYSYAAMQGLLSAGSVADSPTVVAMVSVALSVVVAVSVAVSVAVPPISSLPSTTSLLQATRSKDPVKKVLSEVLRIPALEPTSPESV